MITTPKHRISIVVAGAELDGFESYEITVSMTEVPATFSLRLPFSSDAWERCAPDRPVQVLIDGTPIITGFIEDSDGSDEGDAIEITGRCRLSRLQETAPGINFGGLGIKEVAAKIATPWFSSVTLSNASNRDIIRGRGRKARASSEPIKVNTRVGTQVEPGQARILILDRLAEQAGYLFWSSGNGRELVIGKPNYDGQEPQYRFFRPAPGSSRAGEATVLGMAPRRSTGDRFSRVIVVGSGTGTDANYGAKVAARYGEAKNNPATAEGEGRDFIAPKRLVLVRQISSLQEAQDLADAEMARRDASGYPITVRAAAHGQVIAGTYHTLFAPDTLAVVEDEITGTKGVYLIVSCTYRSSRSGGEETVMQLVRRGTELSR